MCQSSELDAGSDLTENYSFASPPSFHFYLCSSIAVHCISTPNHLCRCKDGGNENRSMFLMVVRNAFSSICAILCLLKVLIEQRSQPFNKFNLKFSKCFDSVLIYIFSNVLVKKLTDYKSHQTD